MGKVIPPSQRIKVFNPWQNKKHFSFGGMSLDVRGRRNERDDSAKGGISLGALDFNMRSSIPNILLLTFAKVIASLRKSVLPTLQQITKHKSMPQLMRWSVIASTCLLLLVTPSSAAQKSKKQAQFYRDQGYGAQRAGNLDMALSYYQKAIGIDSEYAIAYNDIGVVLEAKGEFAKAKEAYVRALALDSKLLGAYYNLAALYEYEGDIKQAAYYWKMRVRLGEWSDPWTWRAKERLDTLQATGKLEAAGIFYDGEAAFGGGSDPKRDAQYHLYRGRQYIADGDYVAALKELSKAFLLDQNNHEIGQLLDETQRRVLLYK